MEPLITPLLMEKMTMCYAVVLESVATEEIKSFKAERFVMS
jgi:hypothetical protein